MNKKDKQGGKSQESQTENRIQFLLIEFVGYIFNEKRGKKKVIFISITPIMLYCTVYCVAVIYVS